MAKHYRVTHERKSVWETVFSGRGYRDCFMAQYRGWLGWRTIAIFPTRDEAEAACHEHAGGTLLPGGTRIISEFERPE